MVAVNPWTNNRPEFLSVDRQVHHVSAESLPCPSLGSRRLANLKGNGAAGERGRPKLENLEIICSERDNTFAYRLGEPVNPRSHCHPVGSRLTADQRSAGEDVGRNGCLPFPQRLRHWSGRRFRRSGRSRFRRIRWRRFRGGSWLGLLVPCPIP